MLGGSTDNWNLQRSVRHTQEWVNAIKVVPCASIIVNNSPEHSYEEEDQSQRFINSMFDEITDL
ncbi:Uncharacterized protein FWK35_00028379 [Aphis craccivora]|uniref:Uncharacterized protein n=1 Tax=Aphis craccivora TaxID=307492 RepID=A0A6G0VWF6_APHCR|nr:Uncharacterized protein FWK35_00028379 [Aphis craccivora]